MTNLRNRGAGVILAADDDPAVLGRICQVLRGDGYRVLAACDGDQALSVFCHVGGDIDLALLDVTMPQLGGPDLISLLLPVSPDLNALYMCGHPYEAQAKALKHEGKFRVLYKPFTPEQLLVSVRVALDGRCLATAAV